MDHQRFELEPLYLQSKTLTALLMRFIPEYFFFRIYIYLSLESSKHFSNFLACSRRNSKKQLFFRKVGMKIIENKCA